MDKNSSDTPSDEGNYRIVIEATGFEATEIKEVNHSLKQIFPERKIAWLIEL